MYQISIAACIRLHPLLTNAVQAQHIDLHNLAKDMGDVKLLVANPYDASLWLAGEGTLFHLGSNGAVLGSTSVKGPIRALSVALDETVWLLAGKWLRHYDRTGILLESRDLSSAISGEPKNLAVDSLGDMIWITAEKRLVQFSMTQLAQSPQTIMLPNEAGTLTLNPLTGEAWLATNKQLLSYSRIGSAGKVIDLQSAAIKRIDRLAFDPAVRALWVAGDKSVIRLNDQGVWTASFGGKNADAALGVPAFAVAPLLAQIRPSPSALTNNAQPVITYGYDASCNGQPCGFTSSYFGGYSLDAKLDLKPVGPFVFDSTTTQASYTPAFKLAEGEHTLWAQAKDAFSHLSAAVTGTFTVDTIGPKFLTLSPVNGSTVTTPQILLQGVVDDPTAIVVLNGIGPASTTVSGAQLNFSIPATLVPGINTLTLSALDKAGNSTTQEVRITYQNKQLTVNMLSPTNGATVIGDNTIITGTIQGPPNTGITINGVVAAQSGNQFFVQIPLQAGTNTLTLIATAQSSETVKFPRYFVCH